MRQMKIAAILIALLVLIATAIAFWGNESDILNGSAVQRAVSEARKSEFEDGRKRAIFILINFLRACGWDIKAIEAELMN